MEGVGGRAGPSGLISEPDFRNLVVRPSVKDCPRIVTTEDDNGVGCTYFLYAIDILVFPWFLAPNYRRGAVCCFHGCGFPSRSNFVGQDKFSLALTYAFCGQRQGERRFPVSIEVHLHHAWAAIAMFFLK